MSPVRPPLAERLERTVVLQWRLAGAWRGVALVIPPLVVIAALTGDRGLVAVMGAVAVIVTAALIWIVPELRWRRWSFAVTDEAVELSYGLLVHVHSVVPHFRVQHLDVERSFLERQLDLATLRITTASAGTDAHVPGLRPERAEAIRRHVLGRTEAGDAV